MAADKTIALIDSDFYANWVFDPSHPTQGRRFIKARELLRSNASQAGIRVMEIDSDFFPTREQLEAVHNPNYIDAVLINGISGEWAGPRIDLARLAHRMAGGTFLAARALINEHARTAVHFAGAKHHAMRDHSSGFCVFNDFALVATYLFDDEPSIERIAILDIDAHHGDGTESLLRHDPRVMTFSIHDGTIFPGTGFHDDAEQKVFNRALDAGAGDEELATHVNTFVQEAISFDPSMIFIAIGADGHVSDPLSTLRYSIKGMEQAVAGVRAAFPDTPLLLGGAGGYQPDTVTPEAWARMALAAATGTNPAH